MNDSGMSTTDAFCLMAKQSSDGSRVTFSSAFLKKVAEEISDLVAHNLELMEANRVMKDELECDEVDDVEYDK